jgi:alcohol dehydrogenase class IV
MGSSLVILDPAITVSTPERVWLSSGMRAVDHCIEGLCSTYFKTGAEQNAKQDVEDSLVAGLKLLLPNLLITKNTPEDLLARQNCMLGVVEAMKGIKAGVAMGASHGIGHQLGPLGVGHGETSCVLLPSVLRYNYRHGEDWIRHRQAKVLSVFTDDPKVNNVLRQGSLNPVAEDLGGAVAAYITALRLPGSLRDVGVGQEKFKDLSKNAMMDRYIPTNPVTITQQSQIEEILAMALGDRGVLHL